MFGHYNLIDVPLRAQRRCAAYFGPYVKLPSAQSMLGLPIWAYLCSSHIKRMPTDNCGISNRVGAR